MFKNIFGKYWYDLLIQMVAIFVSITLSFAFNQWQEDLKNRELEVFYLSQINDDLISDILELEGDLKSYYFVDSAFKFFRKYEVSKNPSLDSLKYYNSALFRETYPNFNSSGFESLKFTGKLEIISNRKILKDLFKIYQEDLATLISAIQPFLQRKRENLVPYLVKNLRSNNNTTNLKVLLEDPEFTGQFRFLNTSEIIERYEILKKDCQNVQLLIEKELKKAGVATKKANK